ncbi:putative rRNA maturation factor [Halanaerobium saccharolyticum]|uniref:Endoribonuclease YbeY n=1 Tax=Halanaerobium saccharolyticum TaxID=43595 RepID=A0A4V3G5J5_9FIRM|nr:rRNA maturation RNase YbeY [Halanaerobium saccharolyticum]RAK10345.1 putative rRNA maturation factor [Halanaerobium saccharolyticum]TDW05291.1 putative rRNA maturation factor [Halanaerobium saccharolyticum]TDX60361.1 putative rRNA maturation factor [Halanaerobium saccharolyticum]
MINVDFNNQQSEVEISQEMFSLLEKVVETAAELEGYSGGEVSVAFVSNLQIKELNQKYREKNEATDVLSFPIDEEMLGDIIISAQRAAVQAEEYGHSLKRELAYLTVHGMLHLFGYDHHSQEEKDEMRQKEERVLTELDISRD